MPKASLLGKEKTVILFNPDPTFGENENTKIEHIKYFVQNMHFAKDIPTGNAKAFC